MPGQKLWGELKTGMTKAAFTALYPTRKIELSIGCIAAIKPSYEDKGISSVELTHLSESSSRSCGQTMLASLREKYGTPRSERQYMVPFDYSCRGKLMCAARDAILAIDKDPNSYFHEASWFTGDTLVTITRDRETDEWSITYEQARLAQPDAASKL
jgi:hypothetical protein